MDEREWCAFQREPKTPLGTDGNVGRRVVERGFDEKDRPPNFFLNWWSAATNFVGGPPRADRLLRLGQRTFLSFEARGTIKCVKLLSQAVQLVQHCPACGIGWMHGQYEFDMEVVKVGTKLLRIAKLGDGLLQRGATPAGGLQAAHTLPLLAEVG